MDARSRPRLETSIFSVGHAFAVRLDDSVCLSSSDPPAQYPGVSVRSNLSSTASRLIRAGTENWLCGRGCLLDAVRMGTAGVVATSRRNAPDHGADLASLRTLDKLLAPGCRKGSRRQVIGRYSLIS
jgi:hypothetical protein